MSVSTTIKEKITAFATDLATLDVLTLTGSITLTPAPTSDGAGTKELKWDEFFKTVAGKINAVGDNDKLEIVAYTHAEIDADSVNYYRSTENDPLLQLHQETVQSATQARMDALAAFAKVLGVK